MYKSTCDATHDPPVRSDRKNRAKEEKACTANNSNISQNISRIPSLFGAISVRSQHKTIRKDLLRK